MTPGDDVTGYSCACLAGGKEPAMDCVCQGTGVVPERPNPAKSLAFRLAEVEAELGTLRQALLRQSFINCDQTAFNDGVIGTLGVLEQAITKREAA